MPCRAEPWFFVTEDMVRFGRMLSPEKLTDMRVAKAIYLLVSGRFEIKLSSLKPWAFYKIQPSCEIWNVSIQPPMKVCFVLISMLYLTGRFEDVALYSTVMKYGFFKRQHYYVRVKIGEKRYDLDPLAYQMNMGFGTHLGETGFHSEIPLILCECENEIQVGEKIFHLCRDAYRGL
ncbi:MAG: hypothetical protein ACP5JR_06555 [Thermoplasmata archaeon]